MSDTAQTLAHQLKDPRASFSIGSLGAIAEFHRAGDEPFEHPGDGNLTIVTARGAVRIELAGDVVPLAYETLSRHRGRWQHGVVMCRPKDAATRRCRTSLTELGPDAGAIRDADRDAILFDIGLGAKNVDFCIRSAEPGLIATLRGTAGQSIFAAGNPAMAALLAANPHRVAVGALGRIEVYQAIAQGRTPEGPHTHVLPKLLKTGRTHSANIPVPRGLIPCLSLYPPHPVFDAMGRPHARDAGAAEAFDRMLRRWGRPDCVAEKDRLTAAFETGMEPGDYPRAPSRPARTAARVALRQLAQRNPDDALLGRWIAMLDGPAARTGI